MNPSFTQGKSLILGAVACLIASAPCADAQSPPLTGLIGTHTYQVRGFAFDMEMEPWGAELSVADTVTDGIQAIHAIYNTRAAANGAYLYSSAATWHRTSAHILEATSLYRGRARGECTMNVSGSRVTMRPSVPGKLIDTTAKYVAVPEFALSAFVASGHLADGDSIRLTVARCSPDTFSFVDVIATVKSGEALGNGVLAQPVWIVEGGTAYPFRVSVAKTGRTILRSLTPQGTVGYSEDVLLGSRK